MKPDKEPRSEKKAVVEELRGQLSDSLFVILTDYKGLNVSKTGLLRDQLAPLDAKYHVVKNRMLAEATKGTDYEDMSRELEGPTAMVCGSGDVVATAKTLRDFIKENNLPLIKMGSMQGVLLSQDDVIKLAALPSREQLLAQVVGTIAAPMTGLVGVLNQKVLSLLYVLKAVQEKKEAA